MNKLSNIKDNKRYVNKKNYRMTRCKLEMH